MSALSALSAFLLLATLALAPLPFGSVEPLWSTVWLGALVASASTASLACLRGSDAAAILPVVLAYAVVVALSLYVTMPDPPFGRTDPAGALPAALLGSGPAPRISATLSNPVAALGPVSAALLAFLRSYALCRDPRGAERVLRTVGVSGVVYALYGVASVAVGSRWLLWQEKTAYLDDLTGTFVNRNTAATYFGSCGLIWLILCYREWERGAPRRGDRRSARLDWLDWSMSRAGGRLRGCAAAAALCLGATAMTGSRAGALATLAAAAACTALFFRDRLSAGRPHARGPRWGVVAVLALGTLAAVEILGGGIAGRIGREGLADADRWAVYGACVRMIADHPWFGIGLGNFEAVFPAYRPEGLAGAGVWERAHATWLQAIVELGCPAGALLLAVAVWLGALLLVGGARRSERRSLPLCGLGVGSIGALHAAVDVPLQVPGYAVVFAAVLACGLAQRADGTGRRDAPARRAGAPPPSPGAPAGRPGSWSWGSGREDPGVKVRGTKPRRAVRAAPRRRAGLTEP